MIAKLQEIIEPIIASFDDLILYDVEFNEHSKILRIFIDRTSGVDVELCARVSDQISQALDQADVIPNRYRLEVSSPGVERRLKRPLHFKMACGKTIRIVTEEQAMVGDLVSADDEGIRISSENGETHFPYALIRRASVVLRSMVKGGKL